MMMSSKSNFESDELTEEECYTPVILGVGSWGCRLLDNIAQDENIAKFHTLEALDTDPDNLETSAASVKILLDVEPPAANGQDVSDEAIYLDMLGKYRQHFENADLVFVLLDTAEADLENFLRFLRVLLGKTVIQRHALTIALLSNTRPF